MRKLLVLIGVPAALIIGAIGVQASNNATWHQTFSIAVVTSLVNNTADNNLGGISAGVNNGGGSANFTITTNDPAGVQLTVVAPAATITESGIAPCVPVAGNTIPASTSSITGAPTTGGSGGVAGTAAAAVTLSTTAQNLFATVPTNTGTLSETVSTTVFPPAGTHPNSNACSYLLTYNFVLIAQ